MAFVGIRKIVVNGKFVGVGGKHNLAKLSEIVGYQTTSREADVLNRLSRFVRFAGRYPISINPHEMAPREIDRLGEVDIGYFSKADFRTCVSVLNKLMTLITGKKRRTFHPLGTLDYITRGQRAMLRRKFRAATARAKKRQAGG